MSDPLPPLDYTRSPYTGWTRAHWQMVLARATDGYVLASDRHGSPARALYPDDRCDRPDSVDALEAFARLALAWGAWLRNPANPAVLWFDGREMNLESLLSRARVFDRLTDAERAQVILLDSRSGHESESPRDDYVSKYGKFAYSTHFPFNVAPAAGSYAPDAMIALTRDGCTFGHRGLTRAGGAAPGTIWCEFDEILDGQPQFLRVAVVLWNDLQVRLAFIRPTLPVRAFEAPGALGCDGAAKVRRKSDPSAGWEYAEAEGRALGIRRLWGYDGQCASAPCLGRSNINLAYPYSEQPVVSESHPSAEARCLAAVSLLRPAPFDPAVEFAGFAVAAEPASSFRVTFPDGETAFVSLGDEPQDIRRLVQPGHGQPAWESQRRAQ